DAFARRRSLRALASRALADAPDVPVAWELRALLAKLVDRRLVEVVARLARDADHRSIRAAPDGREHGDDRLAARPLERLADRAAAAELHQVAQRREDDRAPLRARVLDGPVDGDPERVDRLAPVVRGRLVGRRGDQIEVGVEALGHELG